MADPSPKGRKANDRRKGAEPNPRHPRRRWDDLYRRLESRRFLRRIYVDVARMA